jgi:hypothetical protein
MRSRKSEEDRCGKGEICLEWDIILLSMRAAAFGMVAGR